MGYGVPAAVAASLLTPSARSVNIAGDGDFLMTGQELATATAHGAAGALVIDRRRQRQLRHDPHAPGARVPGPRVSGTDLVNPDFAALGAGLRLARRARRAHRRSSSRRWAALESQRPTLLHLKLDADVITTRTTLTAIREAAQRSPRARET